MVMANSDIFIEYYHFKEFKVELNSPIVSATVVKTALATWLLLAVGKTSKQEYLSPLNFMFVLSVPACLAAILILLTTDQDLPRGFS